MLPTLRLADPQRRPWVDSSPSNGLLSEAPYTKRWGETDINSDGGSAGSWGDVHYYNYGDDCEDAATYPKARGRSPSP